MSKLEGKQTSRWRLKDVGIDLQRLSCTCGCVTNGKTEWYTLMTVLRNWSFFEELISSKE